MAEEKIVGMSHVPDEEILLRVEHLCQYFKIKGRNQYTKAVDDVSFDIKKGEVFGLVGESGCGKTTTGRSIIRLYDITSGNIWFDGHRICAGTKSYKDAIGEAQKKMRALRKAGGDHAQELAELQKSIEENREAIKLAKHDHTQSDKEYAERLQKSLKEEFETKLAAETDPAKREELKKKFRTDMHIAKNTKLVTKIQMIFQDPIASLNPRMTVKEIISEGMIINGIKDKEYIEKTVFEILERVGLVREHAGRYPHEFSGGQRQRIGIARSVVMKPQMIIADEPVSALDVSIQAQVINLLNELRREMGLTILFIAHDLSVVKYFSDRIGVMYFGKMVELATSDELFEHPLHPYTRALLSAIPLPDPLYEKDRVRLVYNPIAEHDYTEDKPSMREITPGHFVYCNDAEEKKYKEELAQ